MNHDGKDLEKRKDRDPQSKRKRKRVRLEQKIQYQSYVKALQLNDRILHPISYVRIIEPYPYTFSTFAKARWVGKSILDVYCSEFGSYPKIYYDAAIRQGRISVSGKQVDIDYIIKGNDVLSHVVHRHEPSVIVSGNEELINIVSETETLVVVDKPATIPVHPCGAYHQNSLLPILEPKFGKLHVIHRLDRLTSGLVLLAKTSSTAQKWGKVLMARESFSSIEKLYLARVRGRFPTQCPSELSHLQEPAPYGLRVKSVLKNLGESTENKENTLGYWITKCGTCNHCCTVDDVFTSSLTVDEWLKTNEGSSCIWLHLACPTRIESHKDGICEAGSFECLSESEYQKSVKSAHSSFGVVSYDESTDSTVLICRPHTGRTHQIRLHLQYLGHPIANDPCYGGDMWYGNEDGKHMGQEAALYLKSDSKLPVVDVSESITVADTPATEEEIEKLSHHSKTEDETMDDFYKRTCVWCARSGEKDQSMLELLVRSRGIWLHALKYRMADTDGTEIEFRTMLPPWVTH
jgi:23S rRNA-/tRNA-specific pseudouridylate synthase